MPLQLAYRKFEHMVNILKLKRTPVWISLVDFILKSLSFGDHVIFPKIRTILYFHLLDRGSPRINLLKEFAVLLIDSVVIICNRIDNIFTGTFVDDLKLVLLYVVDKMVDRHYSRHEERVTKKTARHHMQHWRSFFRSI